MKHDHNRTNDNTNPTPSVQKQHWAGVSDEKLVGLDLEIEGPDCLPDIVTEIPPGDEETYMEFTYDLRGTGREEEFVCVHGHHRHLHGAVMRKGAARFLVGWICAESIYGEDLAKYKADFDAAVQRRGALMRVRELRAAMLGFTQWAIRVSESIVIAQFQEVRSDLTRRFPCVYEILRSSAGRRINDSAMPRYLCDDVGDIEGGFERLLNETAAVNISLTGDGQRVAAKIGATREKIEGIIRRADLLVARLADVELFFQPSTLHAICEHIENAVPRRTRHYAGLLKLTARAQVLEMPKNFAVPDRSPIDRLSAVLAG